MAGGPRLQLNSGLPGISFHFAEFLNLLLSSVHADCVEHKESFGATGWFNLCLYCIKGCLCHRNDFKH